MCTHMYRKKKDWLTDTKPVSYKTTIFACSVAFFQYKYQLTTATFPACHILDVSGSLQYFETLMFMMDYPSTLWPLGIQANTQPLFCFFLLSTPQIYQNPRRPDGRPGGSGFFCVPGHRWSSAQDCLEQKRQKSQQPEIWGTLKLTIFASIYNNVMVNDLDECCSS